MPLIVKVISVILLQHSFPDCVTVHQKESKLNIQIFPFQSGNY